jgi:hypothetical protein
VVLTSTASQLSLACGAGSAAECGETFESQTVDCAAGAGGGLCQPGDQGLGAGFSGDAGRRGAGVGAGEHGGAGAAGEWRVEYPEFAGGGDDGDGFDSLLRGVEGGTVSGRGVFRQGDVTGTYQE